MHTVLLQTFFETQRYIFIHLKWYFVHLFLLSSPCYWWIKFCIRLFFLNLELKSCTSIADLIFISLFSQRYFIIAVNGIFDNLLNVASEVVILEFARSKWIPILLHAWRRMLPAEETPISVRWILLLIICLQNSSGLSGWSCQRMSVLLWIWNTKLFN